MTANETAIRKAYRHICIGCFVDEVRIATAGGYGICLQECKWLKFAEWRLIGFRQIHLRWRLGAPPKTSVSCCTALLPHSARAGPVRRFAACPGRPNSAR
jgi:hypothetical protein